MTVKVVDLFFDRAAKRIFPKEVHHTLAFRFDAAKAVIAQSSKYHGCIGIC